MNILFWGGIVLMLIVAIGIIVWPLLKQRELRSVAYKDSNLGLYEDKLAELEADLAEGRIDNLAYQAAREELDRELLADIPEASRENAADLYGAVAKRKPALAMLVAALLPAISLLLYLQIGMHAESASFHQQLAEQPQKQMSVEEMTTILEDRLKTQGGDAQAWAMLARAYKHLGRYDEAVSAFDVAIEQGKTAQLLLEQVEAMALANGQRFDDKSRAQILKVLDMQPDNANALWFAGVAEYQFGEYWQSVDHLARLAEIAGSDEQVRQSIGFYLVKIREELASKGEDLQPIDEVMQLVTQKDDSMQPAHDGAVTRLTVNVDVSDEIRKQVGASTAVFVYAKAQQGPKMPLAVQRLTLADLPTTVGLDDSMAMVEGMNLSNFDKVVVAARVSKSGTAVTQSGDYLGSIDVDDVSASPTVDVTIDRLVP